MTLKPTVYYRVAVELQPFLTIATTRTETPNSWIPKTQYWEELCKEERSDIQVE
jgi:hypothetical protein